jgi:hypothetical protein
MTMNDAYIPAPSRNADALVVHTPRIRIIVMSTSGLRLRTSTAIQATETVTPTAIRPSVLPDPQPHVVVSEIAINTIDMPAVISAAASQLTRPGSFTGDSGMKRQVASAARTVGISGSQNSQW